jgi:hypothetical protein
MSRFSLGRYSRAHVVADLARRHEELGWPAHGVCNGKKLGVQPAFHAHDSPTAPPF